MIFQRSYLLVFRQTAADTGPWRCFCPRRLVGCQVVMVPFSYLPLDIVLRRVRGSSPFYASYNRRKCSFCFSMWIVIWTRFRLNEVAQERTTTPLFHSSLSHRGSWALSLVMAAGAIAPTLSSSPSSLDLSSHVSQRLPPPWGCFPTPPCNKRRRCASACSPRRSRRSACQWTATTSTGQRPLIKRLNCSTN